MRFQRCTKVILCCYLFFICIAAYLDEPGFFFLACSLGLFLLYRYCLFLTTIHHVSQTCKISRKLNKRFIRQGHHIKVICELGLISNKNLQIQYTEKKIPEIIVDKGNISCFINDEGPQKKTLTYWIIPIIHGNIEFFGGELQFSDPFFEYTVHLSKPQYTQPEMKIQPVPLFQIEELKSNFGGLESNRFSLIHGTGVRSFREYSPGDDIKKIDWKLSAKHNTLYIRELAGLQDKPPLVIVDLPEKNRPYDLDGFNKIIRAITGIIDETLSQKSTISILVISGPNVITTLFDEGDWSRCMELIRETFHPHVQIHHLYHVKKRETIRNEIKELKKLLNNSSSPVLEIYYKKRVTVLQKILLDPGISHFSYQISKILNSVDPDELFLYSLCEYDMSHLQEILVQSRYKKIKFNLKTPSIHKTHFIHNSFALFKGENIGDIE